MSLSSKLIVVYSASLGKQHLSAAFAALMVSLTLGCGANSTSLQSAESYGALAANFDQYQKAFRSPDYAAGLKVANKADITLIYSNILGTINNESYKIGNFEFHDQLKMQQSMKAEYQRMHSSYGSLGTYWKALGVDLKHSTSIAEYHDGLAVMEKSFQGWKSNTKTVLTDEEKVLAVKAQLVILALVLPKKPNPTGLNLEGEGGMSAEQEKENAEKRSKAKIVCVMPIFSQCGDGNTQNNNVHPSSNFNGQVGFLAAGGIASANGNGADNGNNNGNGSGVVRGNGVVTDNGNDSGNGNGVIKDNGKFKIKGNGVIKDIGTNSGNGNGVIKDIDVGTNNGNGNGANNSATGTATATGNGNGNGAGYGSPYGYN